MSIKEMEALLETTRKKIAGQARLNACCVDTRLLDKERELEQALHYLEKGSFILDSIDDYATREQANLDAPTQDLGDIAMPSVAPAVLELLTPPHGRFFRNGVEHTLTQEQSNEEIDAFIERKILEEQNTSSSKWVHNARKQVKLPYKPVMEIDDSNTLSNLLAEYDFEGMDSAQVYASLDPTSTTSDNNESNASKLNETPTKEDV
jgi:hypothetical protein